MIPAECLLVSGCVVGMETGAAPVRGPPPAILAKE